MSYVSLTDCHNRMLGDPDDFLAHCSHSPPRRRYATRLYPPPIRRRVPRQQEWTEPNSFVSTYADTGLSADKNVVVLACVVFSSATALVVLALSMNATTGLVLLIPIVPLRDLVVVSAGADQMTLHVNGSTTVVSVLDDTGTVTWTLHLRSNKVVAENMADTNCFHVSATVPLVNWEYPGTLFSNSSSINITTIPRGPGERMPLECRRGVHRLNRLHSQIQIKQTMVSTADEVVAHMTGRLYETYTSDKGVHTPSVTAAATAALANFGAFFNDDREIWWHKWCKSNQPHPLSTTCSQLGRFIDTSGRVLAPCTKVGWILSHLNVSKHNRCGYCNEYNTAGCDCWAAVAVVYLRLITSPCERVRKNCTYDSVPYPCIQGQSCSNGSFNNCVDLVSVCHLTLRGSCVVVYPRYNMFAKQYPSEVFMLANP